MKFAMHGAASIVTAGEEVRMRSATAGRLTVRQRCRPDGVAPLKKQPPSNDRSSITVGIATLGRPSILAAALGHLRRQTRQPDALIVSATTQADIPESCLHDGSTRLLLSAQPSLTGQRNVIVEQALGDDILVFFDDDFFPHESYLEMVARHFAADPSIVVATGTVIADGIKGAGLTPDHACALLDSAKPGPAGTVDVLGVYGCNMAIRIAPLREHGIRFDERLRLYAWQEDTDISRRIAPYGRIVRLTDAIGVHLGVKLGRGSGVRLGYSQVANPLYIHAKHVGYPLRIALKLMGKNLAMNALRALLPEPHVDRRGRLRGNVTALKDLLTGKLDPERILEL